MPLHRFPFRAMASPCALSIVAAGGDADAARRAADAAIAEVARIEAKYSRYRDDSVTTAINRAAGGARVAIDAETSALLDYADRCHALSGGAFDLTSGVLRRAWDFKGSPPRLPGPAALAAAVALIGWDRVERGGGADGWLRLPRGGDGNRLRRHRQGIRGRPRGDDAGRTTA